jgi:hypothetical protein
MKRFLGALCLIFTLCNAVVVPKFYSSNNHPRISTPRIGPTTEYTLETQLEKRTRDANNVKVTLALVESGYCGNISMGSQQASVLSMFDLGGSQLSALSPTVEFCAGSDDCSSASLDHGSYNPALSNTATDLAESFEVSTTTATLTGTLYEDSVVIGGRTIFEGWTNIRVGIHLSKQHFGFAHKVQGSNSPTIHDMHSYAGVVGLSGCNSAGNDRSNASSLLETLFAQNVIQYPGFSLWMNPMTETGEIIFGAIDTSKYTGALYLFDLVAPETSYSISLLQISSGSTSASNETSQIDMVFDTTTANIVLPQTWQAAMTELLNAEIGQNSTLLVPCTPSERDIEFTFDSGFNISIPLSGLIGSATGENGLCLSLVQFTETDSYVLGTAFLEYVYLVLTTNSSTGAIAQSDFSNATSSNLIQMTAETPLPNAVQYVESSNSTTDSSISTSSTQVSISSSSVTAALLLATTGSVETETLVSTITVGTSSQVITTVITTVLSRDVSATVSTAATTSAVTLGTTTSQNDASSSSSSGPTANALIASTESSGPIVLANSSVPTTSTSSSQTVNALVASVFFYNGTSSASTLSTDPADPSASSNSVSSLTVVTTSGSITTTINLATVTGSVHPSTSAIVEQSSFSVTSSLPSDPTSPGARTTNAFYFQQSTSSSPPSSVGPTPTPTLSLNLDIFIQNSVILTNTQKFVSDVVKAVTVTTTTTVTTTVPCSTDPTIPETLTAKVVQILIVPSPTPYVDPGCGCTKTDIVYIDYENLTKTIVVQSADPAASTTQEADPVCGCVDCYYTVKKTCTVTSTCTATPVQTQSTTLPTFISGSTGPVGYDNRLVIWIICMVLFAWLL